jgi:hypothetical protein
MYVCLYVFMYASTSLWFTKDVTGAVCECMYDVCVFVCVCVYVFMYASTSSQFTKDDKATVYVVPRTLPSLSVSEYLFLYLNPYLNISSYI